MKYCEQSQEHEWAVKTVLGGVADVGSRRILASVPHTTVTTFLGIFLKISHRKPDERNTYTTSNEHSRTKGRIQCWIVANWDFISFASTLSLLCSRDLTRSNPMFHVNIFCRCVYANTHEHRKWINWIPSYFRMKPNEHAPQDLMRVLFSLYRIHSIILLQRSQLW